MRWAPHPPPAIATFDSATAMAMAIARSLDGKDFPDLGQSPFLHAPVAASDLVPRGLRSYLFAVAGAREGVRPDRIETVNSAKLANWLVSLYPQRKFPIVALGSSCGAFVHLCAAAGIPWLPQTVLVPVRRERAGDPEDACEALALGSAPGERLLACNPDVQLHQLHDPNQDRLMVRYMLYFRLKWRCLPEPYRDFLERSLAPGGTILLVACRRSWPTVRVGPRHVFQHGAVGGANEDEYYSGSERVSEHLRHIGSARPRWVSPVSDGISPEAEWGFEDALVDSVVAWARARGTRVLLLSFDRPEDLSAPIADLYRTWYRRRSVPEDRLHVQSFIMLEPHWTMRLGLVPFWMVFNMERSADRLEKFLDERPPFEEIALTLFAHGVDSVGLPPIERWHQLLSRARRRGRFVGVNTRTYPAHFSVFARYQAALRKLKGPRIPFKQMSAEEALHTLAEDHAMRLEQLC
ncbi:hypothetical protein [Dongia deserti]|uniref:hypothetical protein n=1 Tax=Dongia deserti TaxID=2268030 RepID=UPI0013C411FA|nr:hypothetical protein [Dongia deserti]